MADRHSKLAARRPGQQLAQREQGREAIFVEPPQPGDEGFAKIADMGYGAAERGEPEPQKGKQHRQDATILPVARHDQAFSFHPRFSST
jgi:hypothetical protein